MLQELLLQTTNALGADSSQMALYDATRHCFLSFALVADGEIIEHPADFPLEMSADSSDLYAVLRDRREPRLFDPEGEPELFWPGTLNYHRRIGSRTVQCIPLRFGDRFMGFMGLAFRSAARLGPADFEGALRQANQAAMAVELKRLADAEQAVALERARQRQAAQRAAELERANAALQETINAVTRIGTLDILMPRVIEIVARAFGVVDAGFFEHTDQRINLRYWLRSGRMVDATDLPGLDGQGQAVARRMAEGFTVPPEHLGVDYRVRLRPSLIDHRSHTASPDLHDFCRQMGWHSELNIPLFADGRTDAAITLFRHRDCPFSEDDIPLAEALGQQISLARQVSRLATAEREAAILRDREQAGHERAILLERANQAMQQTVDLFGRIETLSEAVPAVLRIVAAAFGAEHCAYCEHPEGTIYLRHWYWSGRVLDPESLPGLTEEQRRVVQRLARGFRAPDSHLGSDAVNRAHPVVVDHRALLGDLEIQRFCLAMGWEQELNIPLMVNARAIAGLVVYRKGGCGFSDHEVTLGAALAKQLALAVEMVRRGDALREAAVLGERERSALARAAELERSNDALQKTIDAVARLESLAAFVPQALRIVAAAFEVRSAGFFELSESRIFLRYWYLDGQVFGPDTLPGLPAEQFGLLIRMAAGFVVPDAYLGIAPGQQQRAVIIDHRTDGVAPEFDAFARSMGWAHELNAPMMAEGRSLGSLTLYREASRPFSESDIRLAESLLRPVALALQTSKIAGREAELAIEQRRFSELARANDALRVSLNALQEEEAEHGFLRQSLQQIQSLAGAAGIWLFGCTQGDGSLRLLGCASGGRYSREGLPDDPPIFREGFPMRPELLAELQAHGRLVWQKADPAAAIAAEPLEPICGYLRRGHRAHALHALTVGERQVGLIGMVFDSELPLSEAQCELIHTLCQPLTLALELARLSGESRQNAARAAVLAERERMAAEIHDSLAQSFTAIALQAESLGSRFDRPSAEAALVGRIEQAARHGLAEVRSSLLTLKALEGPPGTLDKALAQLAMRSEVPGTMRCDFITRGAACEVNGEARESLMRIAREALHNAMRHSGGSTIRLALEYADSQVLLTVDDDGKGLSAESSPARSGHGLEGMARRAREIGAQIRIEASPLGGTRVAVLLPCRGAPAAGSAK